MTDTLTSLHEQQQADGAVWQQYDGVELPEHYGDSAVEYQAVLRHVAMRDMGHAGRLWLRDKDRAALLHRLSTNAIEGLASGQGTQTVMATPIGRIIDLLTVHVLPDELLIITSPQQGEGMYNHLRKNIFFNDKVKLENASDSLGQVVVYGAQSAAMLHQLTGTDVAALALHHIIAATIDDVALWVARVPPLGGAGFAIYAPADALGTVWAALRRAQVQPLGQAAYDTLRVEAGYATYGRELSRDYIPLETGLWDAISFTKGCYVGQEIIARMESRNRLAKKLRGLRLDTPIAAPHGLSVAGKDAGTLTSVVESPRFGLIGLAYVRTAYADPGTTLEVSDGGATAEVVELPFM